MRLALRLFSRLGVIGCLSLLSGCGGEAGKPTLTLFVAASLTDVMQELAAEFAEREGVELVYNFAGSGALAQQLIAAPRADVFVSASERWMDEVERAGRLLEGTRRALLSNQLVVVANTRAEYELSDVGQLCELPFAYLAMGDPESVPAGRYAKEFLRSARCGGGSVWDALRDRISPTPDVRAALAQVSGSRDVVGIVYRTEALARSEEARVIWEVSVAEGPRIRYPAAALREAANPDLARAFLAFLESDAARRRFEAAGFVWIGEER